MSFSVCHESAQGQELARPWLDLLQRCGGVELDGGELEGVRKHLPSKKVLLCLRIF